MQLLIQTCRSEETDLGNDHLSCGFGLRWSYLALEWESGQGKVGFRWEVVTVTFYVNFSLLEAKNSICVDFIAWNGSVAFLQECNLAKEMN